MYKDILQGMIIKGIIGFLIGFAFAYFGTGTSFEIWGGCVFGIIFAGFPYGWGLFGKILGGWCIVGDFSLVFASFLVRLLASLFLGWIAYPIALIFYIVKASKEKHACD